MMLHLVATIGTIVAQAEDEAEGIDLLLPESSELWAGIVAFAIVFFFVWKWALPALNKALEGRQQAIRGQLEEAEGSKLEAERLLKDYEAQLADARNEANTVIEEARQTADSMRADIVAKAQAEANEITRRAREEALRERDRVAEELRDEVAILSLDVAEKVVAGGLDREAQQDLVDRYIDELGGIKR